VDRQPPGSLTLDVVAAPVAAGERGAVVTAFHTERGRRLLAPFAHVGRMALTNYLAQGLFIAFVLFDVGPGLALAGRVGTCALTAIVVVAFAAQMVVSRWWLGRYRHGPLEWVWRRLTYGRAVTPTQ
jgi:uncharacterized protein